MYFVGGDAIVVYIECWVGGWIVVFVGNWGVIVVVIRVLIIVFC